MPKFKAGDKVYMPNKDYILRAIEEEHLVFKGGLMWQMKEAVLNNEYLVVKRTYYNTQTGESSFLREGDSVEYKWDERYFELWSDRDKAKSQLLYSFDEVLSEIQPGDEYVAHHRDLSVENADLKGIVCDKEGNTIVNTCGSFCPHLYVFTKKTKPKFFYYFVEIVHAPNKKKYHFIVPDDIDIPKEGEFCLLDTSKGDQFGLVKKVFTKSITEEERGKYKNVKKVFYR